MPRVVLDKMPDFQPGWVWLTGAGPGDPGLLTLHAVNALQQADAIIYDALVSEDILKLAPEGADLFYAGKRGGKPSMKQEDISQTLVMQAKAGKRVLRLKGGDPFVFGRGGEEAERLVAENIPFRVIPGVTAGAAAPAYAGIPVTHRDVNHAVTFVTGHLAGTGKTELLDWDAISRGSPVIVIYMAMSKLGVIAGKLMEAGRAAGEPVAIVTKATTKAQQNHVTTLGAAASDVDRLGLEPPSIVVIGDVVHFAEKLDWLGLQA
ncbi:MAG: uroporphyrinogen-III C-methyltransferase [Parvibaculales bacterium]